MSNFQVTPVTGLPQINGWSQVISHPSGSFFCVLAIEGQNANSVGKNLSEFLVTKTITTSSQLHNILLDLLQKARKELCKVQLSCFILSSENKVIAATYRGSVLLKRKEKVGEILSSEGSLRIIEGNFQKQDLFILVTEQAKKVFPELKNLLVSKPEHIATKLVANLQEEKDSALTALVLLEDSTLNEDTSAPEKEGELRSKRNYPGVQITKSKKLSFNFSFMGRKLVKVLNSSSQILKKSPSIIKRLFKKPSFLTEKIESENNSKNFSIFLKGTFIVITILVGIIFWKQQSLQKELKPILPTLQNIDQRFETLLTQSTSDPLATRTGIRSLLHELEDLISQNQDKQQVLEEIKKHYQKIQDFSETISGVETQGPLDPFFDLRLTEPSFVTKETSINGTTLFALDAAGKYGITIDLDTKKTKKFSLEVIEKQINNIALNEKILYTLGNGIHSFEVSDSENHNQLKEEGDSDRGGTFLQVYSSYLYIFNPEKRNIYRYVVKDGKLSEPIGWLIDKQNLDFTNIESMIIDGDVWLSNKKGEILKYTQGQKQDFSAQNLPQPFDGPIKLATNEESDFLYILDKNNQRVVVLQKDGTFVKEITSESLSSGENIVALEDETGILVISGSLIYKISL
ncbi:MAG: hypothetical protein HN981_04520 [Candidatus Pacebacteria bacterium]|nr:hypothetical protein [Candidatus Paceibacterota bacterium]MBT4652510.1 hypothetical protein [Candidatus Paceibacterota bacterium]MBT6756337.1 hypothetical protein [Candidatus Paceibacterota bacterium]MBT6921628.1 hypothetical protein [Candidatus Paceibacterota bacterium]